MSYKRNGRSLEHGEIERVELPSGILYMFNMKGKLWLGYEGMPILELTMANAPLLEIKTEWGTQFFTSAEFLSFIHPPTKEMAEFLSKKVGVPI